MSPVSFLLLDNIDFSPLCLARRFFLVTPALLKFRAAVCRNSDMHSKRVHDLRCFGRRPHLPSTAPAPTRTIPSTSSESSFRVRPYPASGRHVRQVRPRERTHASPHLHDRPFLEEVAGSAHTRHQRKGYASLASRQFFGDSLSSVFFCASPSPMGRDGAPYIRVPRRYGGRLSVPDGAMSDTRITFGGSLCPTGHRAVERESCAGPACKGTHRGVGSPIVVYIALTSD